MKEFKRHLCLAVLFCSLCACSVPARAQEKPVPAEQIAEYVPPQPESPGGSFISFLGTMFKIGVSLSIIVIFIYLTVFVLKGFTSSSRGPAGEVNLGSLSLVDTLSLRPHQTVFMVRAGREILVLASSEKDLSLLSRIEDQAAVEEIVKAGQERWQQAKPFGTYLQAAQKKHYLKMYVKEYLDSVKTIFKGRPKE